MKLKEDNTSRNILQAAVHVRMRVPSFLTGMQLAIRHYRFMSPFLEELFRGDYFK